MKPNDACLQALRLTREGADIIDLGAESSRPGAKAVSEEEELNRLLPVLQELRRNIQIPISIDTTKSKVAQAALELGAEIINDVSGLANDPELANVVSEFGAGLILMHRRGSPKTMQSLAHYEDVMREVTAELSQSMEVARSRGVSFDQIVCDPGIGFAKTADQNLEVLERLSELKELGRPILVGPSRKSFIGAITKQEPRDRLFGTVSACVLAFERGARILRVHDVKPVKEALLIAEAVVSRERKVSL